MFFTEQTPTVADAGDAIRYNLSPQIDDRDSNPINELLTAISHNMVGRFDTSHVLARTAADLDSLCDLADSWDDTIALPVNIASIRRGLIWIHQMYSDACASQYRWIEPHVSSNEDGDVTFEWWNDGRKLTVYVTPYQSRLLKVWGPDVLLQMWDGSADSIEERQDAWGWLLGTTSELHAG